MTAKQKLFAKIDELAGKARVMYYVPELAKYMIGRGKVGIAPIASNPPVQFGQSQWMSSTLETMTGGGGTTGKSALWAALVGNGPIPADWTEASRLTILADMLLFRSFPSAISLVAHMTLDAFSDTQLKAEAKKRWGAKVATAFVAWHKATVTFLSAISEVSEDSPATRRKASTLPNLSELIGYSKARSKSKKPSSRPVAPSARASARAKKLAEAHPSHTAGEIAHIESLKDDVKAKVAGMAPVK